MLQRIPGILFLSLLLLSLSTVPVLADSTALISLSSSGLQANGALSSAADRGTAGGPLDGEPLAPKEASGLFTAREHEVLRSLTAGLSNQAIAARLGVSRFTIRSHVQHILGKAGVHTRSEAVAFAFRHHLL